MILFFWDWYGIFIIPGLPDACHPVFSGEQAVPVPGLARAPVLVPARVQVPAPVEARWVPPVAVAAVAVAVPVMERVAVAEWVVAWEAVIKAA